MRDEMEKAVVGMSGQRDEYEIREDLRAVKCAMAIFKDSARLKDVQEMIKQNKKTQESLDFIADGDLQQALGLK
ncbi:MAG: hypothetical protein WBK67_02430 [Minisyncoccales bacterium]